MRASRKIATNLMVSLVIGFIVWPATKAVASSLPLAESASSPQGASFFLALIGVGLTAGNLIYTSIIATKARKIDLLEEKLETSLVNAITREIKQVKDLNDERFGHVWKRFEAGEQRFERLEQRDQRIELQIERRLADIHSDVAVIKRELGIKDGH